MRKKIDFLRLHQQESFVPGYGQLGTTFPPINKSMIVNMYFDTDMPTVVILEINGKEHFTPITNVQMGSFAAEEPKKK